MGTLDLAEMLADEDNVEQWLKWFCEAGGGSSDEARLEQTPYPYPFQPR